MSDKLKFIISPSTRETKKFMVVVEEPDGFRKTIHFGAKGYSDYTLHKDYKRMLRYSKRHKPNEDWKNPLTAGFWAKWILWNKPSLKASILDTQKRFKIKIDARKLKL